MPTAIIKAALLMLRTTISEVQPGTVLPEKYSVRARIASSIATSVREYDRGCRTLYPYSFFLRKSGGDVRLPGREAEREQRICREKAQQRDAG
jgi:hypothetical protein